MSSSSTKPLVSSGLSIYEEDEFKKNGFLKVKNLFPIDAIESIEREINESAALLNAEGAVYDLIDAKKELRYVPRPQAASPLFQKLLNSNVLSLSSQILNEDVYFVGMDLHCRAAGAEYPTPPHQDSFLFCLEDGYESLISCYISISGMNTDCASLRFIKGSHLLPTLQHKQSAIRGFSSVIEESHHMLPEEMLQNEEVIELEKGECVFFHSKTIHFTDQQALPSRNRSSVSIRIGGYNVKYSTIRQEEYKKFVAFNRSNTLAEGLTLSIPKPQHV